MSKWLRRGFGHNNSTEASSHHQQQHQYQQQPQHHHSGSSNNNTSEFPSPPRNHLHPGTYHSEQQQQQPHLTGTANHTPNTSAAASSQPTMVGAYTTVQTAQQPSTTATIDMDVDTSTRDSKYSQVSPQQQQHHPYGGDMGGANSYHPHNTSMKQDPSGRMLDDRSARGRSGGSRMDRARLRQNQPPPPHHHYGSASQNNQVSAPPPQAPPLQPSQQQQSYHPHNRGATTTGATTTSAHFGPPPPHHHHGATPLTPYGNSSNANNINTSSGGKGIHTTSSPPDSAQPTYPPPAVTADSPQPSETAGSSSRRPAYLLHRDLVIGKGSYGQVCIASRGESEGHHTAARSGKRKKFACKCVMLRNDPKYIAKLQEEVNVLRELRGHDNVIRLYDVFCVDNELFIITELGRGGDLFHLLTTHPKHGVTEAYAAKTVVEMLSAVAFLHCRSICHRDLKLENWVLESGKDVWSPLKLIDFGLSTHFTRGQRLSRVVGSSYYVAPEVLKKSYTEACDLWSLGVIVYMLLSGAPPFYGKNDEAIKASIVQGEYTFPHELFRDVSDEAMAFVSTLLSYNIDYRYTADQALTHPWLAANCEPLALQKAKDGARGIGIHFDRVVDPMQM